MSSDAAFNNLTFDLVELHGLKWFNFSMRPTRSLSSVTAVAVIALIRRVVERHMAASGVTAIELLRLRLLA